jgi:hypothetical protein
MFFMNLAYKNIGTMNMVVEILFGMGMSFPFGTYPYYDLRII